MGYITGYVFADEDYSTEQRLRDEAVERLERLKAQSRAPNPKPWYLRVVDKIIELRQAH